MVHPTEKPLNNLTTVVVVVRGAVVDVSSDDSRWPRCGGIDQSMSDGIDNRVERLQWH